MDRTCGNNSRTKSVFFPENSSDCSNDETLYTELSFNYMNTETYSDCDSTLTSMSEVSSGRQHSHSPIDLSSNTPYNELQVRRRWALLSNVLRFACRCWVATRQKRWNLIRQRRPSSFGKAPIQNLQYDNYFDFDVSTTALMEQPCSSTSLLQMRPEQGRISQSKARRMWRLLFDETKRRLNIFERDEERPLFNHRVVFFLWISALFPPDYEFERDTLVQLWIAAGFFVQEPMEENAALFFKQCLARGQFEFSRLNLVTGEAMYKVKGPLQCSGSTDNHTVRIGRISDLANISSQITHLSIRCNGLTKFADLDPLKGAKHLRSLIFLQGHELSITHVPRDFFLSMTLLRTLDLSRTHLIELPSSIGSMTCLHYIDLSETPITCLPETVECLTNLQTLKLRGCSKFSALPNGMSKLVNLRHLDLDILGQLSSLPPKMGALTKLRTLSAFIIDEEEECSIRQLMDMNNLSGSFCISRLENVLTKEEAIEACLYKKSELRKLEFRWSNSQSEDEDSYGDVLSSLRPTLSLEELQVSCYGGSEWPSWISDPQFADLVSITLLNCDSCLVLPSLGQLPALKYLNLVDFYGLMVIDQNFYRGSSTQGHIAFPALEELTVENMNGLETWEQIRKDDFPCLRSLNVKHCPKLRCLFRVSWLKALDFLEITHCPVLASFPHFDLPKSLKELVIEGCPSITKFFDSKIPDIPSVWIDHQEILIG